MSIDEMIKAGKTLPEIQAELKKAVAARDEEALKKAREEGKINKARTDAISALQSYFAAIGIPMDSKEDYDQILDIFKTIESSITPAYKKLFEIRWPKSAAPASTKIDEDEFHKCLRAFLEGI